MYEQKTLPGFDEYTCSPDAAAGNSPCDSPDGTTGKSGRGVALANRTAPSAKGSGTQTRETSGPSSSGSSASAALSASLANRCQALLATAGSMEYRQTWRQKATPSGRLYWAHTASAGRTSGSGCTGWPTPMEHDGTHGARSEASAKKGSGCLHWTAKLAGWATPSSQVFGDTPETHLARKRKAIARGKSMGLVVSTLYAQAHLAGWRIPTAGERVRSQEFLKGREPGPQELVGWATPQHCDGRGATGPASKNKELGRGAALSSATTANTAGLVLAPEMSRWLMAYPAAWDSCAPGSTEWTWIQAMLRKCSESSRLQDGTEQGG